MREIVQIPSGGWTLHGVVHLPTDSYERRVGVVILLENHNTKFGAHGLYPELGDTLARAGLYVLRYDNRGLCDSPCVAELTFANRVADARASLTFFRRQYRLDAVLAWGLCMGAAVGVHCGVADDPEEKFDGLILCNILAHPTMASMPEFSYQEVDLPSMTRNIFCHENPAAKLWHVVRNPENWTKTGPLLLRRYFRSSPEMKRLCKAIEQVPELLVRYDGPMLMIFSERDRYWMAYRERVNPNDRIGLARSARKKILPTLAIVKDGDHTFASREQTAEMFRYTLDWLRPYLTGN